LFKQIGRLTFLLSSASVAVLCGVALGVQQSHPDSRHVALAFECGLALLGVFWIRSLERRLIDAGLPRWSFWPYFLLVIAACFGVHALRNLDVPHTLAFFVALQIPSVLFPSKPAPARPLAPGAGQAGASGYPYSEYNSPVNRFQFLLRVLLVAALFIALFHLGQKTDPGTALWEMRIGLVLPALIWIYSVEGRVMDAGLPRWLSIPYCLILPGACFLPVFLEKVSLHVALPLFVVLQIPTIFFPSRAMLADPQPLSAGPHQASSSPAMHKNKPVPQASPLSGFEFAVYILLIAGLWFVLHLLRGDAGGAARSWAFELPLDAGSAFLWVLWMISVNGRLRDAARQRFAGDFCLIVFTASLLPFAFGILSFPQALVLFAALQIPAVLIRRESTLARFLPVDTDS
jgi:hypothetical protein